MRKCSNFFICRKRFPPFRAYTGNVPGIVCKGEKCAGTAAGFCSAGVARLCCLIFVVGGVFMNLAGAEFLKENLQVLYLITVIQSTAYVLTMFAGSQLIADPVEVSKYRTGREVGGIVSSLYRYVQKLVNSLVGSVILLILTAYGWQSVKAQSLSSWRK